MSQVIQGEVLSLDATSLPATGLPGEIRLDTADNQFKYWDSVQTAWVRITSSGSLRSANVLWSIEAGEAPIAETENGIDVVLFEPAITQKLFAAIRVPVTYAAGSPITMSNYAYSPASSNEWRVQTISTLIREGVDAVDSTANQRVSSSGDITNSVANQLRNFENEISDSVGQINGVAVSPRDLIIVELSRQSPGGTEDTEDLRLLADSTEVRF